MKENSKSILKKACAVTLTATMLMGGGLTEIGKYIGTSISAAAADIVTSGSCGDNVKYTLDSEGTLTISGTGKMKDYGYNKSPFYQNQNVKKVIIEDGVTSIGEETFEGCTSLTNIKIPDSVTSIEGGAFSDCTSLTNIKIPDSVTSVGNRAFEYTAWYNNQPDGVVYAGKVAYTYKYKGEMPKNTKITLKDGTVGIAYCAFMNCKSLAEVTIPNSVTSIEGGAFAYCESLKEVTIGNSVTSIGETAFYSCTGLTKVTIGNSVTSIESGAFSSCTSLTEVTIPDSVTSIGENAFYSCTGLTKVTIGNSVTSIGEDAFYSCTSLANIKIPDSVTSIGEHAFCDCTSLKEVTIPNSVTSIGSGAFSSCTSLTEVTIPDSVTSIGRYAFYSCTGLTKVTIPDSVTSIGWGAFEFCTNLKNIGIPNSVTSIGKYAFHSCASLTNIKIPDSVTSIGANAFAHCTNLKNIEIPNSVTSIGEYAFYSCTSLANIKIPDSVTSIGEYAFCDCTSLKEVTIPNSVTSIGRYAFSSCTSLTDVYYTGSKEEWEKTKIYDDNGYLTKATIHYNYVPSIIDSGSNNNIKWTLNDRGVLTITGKGDMPNYKNKTSPFYGNNKIQYIVIKDGITSIGAYAFQDCKSLNFVELPNSIKKIETHAFDGSSLWYITVPKGTVTVGDSAFKNCSELISAELPDSLTSIGGNAFYGCSKLTSIDIPSNVNQIGSSAFESCGIKNIVLPSKIETINASAFKNCKSLTDVSFTYNMKKICESAFEGCTALKNVQYTGFKEEWNKIIIESNNDPLKNAKVSTAEIKPVLEEELLKKTGYYTSDGGEFYRKMLEKEASILANDSVSQENKMNSYRNFLQMFDIENVSEGTAYENDCMNGKRAYDYLTNDEVYLSYQFANYLHNTPKGTVARGLMLTDGWIFNNEIKQYMDLNTYITQETVSIKNYKAMLLDYMDYKSKDNIASEASKIEGYANKVKKFVESIAKGVNTDTIKKFETELDRCTNPEQMNNVINKYNVLFDSKDDVWYLEGFDELKNAFKYSGKFLKITKTGIDDVLSLIEVESKLEAIQKYKKFLTFVVEGKEYLPADMVIAAKQLLDKTVNPYKEEIINFIYDIGNCVDSVWDFSKTIKKTVSDTMKKKYPNIFTSEVSGKIGTFGDAIEVIEVSAMVTNALTNVGAMVKNAAYVEGYAYLGIYFSDLLEESKSKFNSSKTVDNAWDFYDIYNMLFKIRTYGENSYLKMCKTDNITKILMKYDFDYFNISDREKYVKDSFDFMNDYCYFGLENAGEIPESHKFAQKAVIKCPVNVEIYDQSGSIIYTIYDGKEIDETNSIGRFISKYDAKNGEYIKIAYLNDNKKYKIKAVGVDSGNVDIATAVTDSTGKVVTAKCTGLAIENNGNITVDMNTFKYTSDKLGDGKNKTSGTLKNIDSDKIIQAKSIALTQSNVRIDVGEKTSLGVIITPTNATFTDVVWTSSDESVATVKNGAVTAVSAGTATITAATSDGKLSVKCVIIVTDGLLGDTNGDGKVNIADALMIARYDAKLTTLNDTQLSVSDVNGDSKVNIADALKIARYDAKLIDKL